MAITDVLIVKNLWVKRVKFVRDSNMIIQQINGVFAIKEPALDLNQTH